MDVFIYESETNVNHNKVQQDVTLHKGYRQLSNAESREMDFLREEHISWLSYTRDILWAEQFLICMFSNTHTDTQEATNGESTREGYMGGLEEE